MRIPLLTAILSICSGCSLLGPLYWSPSSSAPELDRSKWKTYHIVCGEEVLIFNCPVSKRFRATHRPALSDQEVTDRFVTVAFLQPFDVESRNPPQFEFTVWVIPDHASDLLELGPKETQKKPLKVDGRSVKKKLEQIDGRTFLVTRIFSKAGADRKPVLLGSNYEAIIGGHEFRLMFGYDYAKSSADPEWTKQRTAIERDLVKSIAVRKAGTGREELEQEDAEDGI